MRNHLLKKDFFPLQAYAAYGLVLWCLFVYFLHGAFVGETFIPSYRGRGDRNISGYAVWLFPAMIALHYMSIRIGKDKFLSRRTSQLLTGAELLLLCVAVGSAWYLADG